MLRRGEVYDEVHSHHLRDPFWVGKDPCGMRGIEK